MWKIGGAVGVVSRGEAMTVESAEGQVDRIWYLIPPLLAFADHQWSLSTANERQIRPQGP